MAHRTRSDLGDVESGRPAESSRRRAGGTKGHLPSIRGVSWLRRAATLLVLSAVATAVLFHRSTYFPLLTKTMPGAKQDPTLASPLVEGQRVLVHDHALSRSIAFLEALQQQDISGSRTSQLQANGISADETESPDVCVAVVTGARTVPYIVAMITTLMHQAPLDTISWGGRDSRAPVLQIHVLSSDTTGASDHWLNALEKTGVRLRTKASWRQPKHNGYPWHVLEIIDYTAALATCENSTAPWTLILEDDALAMSDMVSELIRSTHSQLSPEQQRRVGYVKLFVNDSWDGWESIDFLPMLLCCSLAGLVLSVLAQALFSRTAPFKALRMAWWQLAILLSLALFLNSHVAGKQALNNLFISLMCTASGTDHRLLPLGRHHIAGTVAIGFPTKPQVPALRQWLDHQLALSLGKGQGAHRPLAPIDVLIGRLEDWSARPSLALELRPSLVQHIGVHSTGPSSKNHGCFLALKQDSMLDTLRHAALPPLLPGERPCVGRVIGGIPGWGKAGHQLGSKLV